MTGVDDIKTQEMTSFTVTDNAEDSLAMSLNSHGNFSSFGSLRVKYAFRSPDDLETWWCCYDLHSVNSQAPRQSLFRGFSSSSEIKASTLVALGNVHFGQDGIEFRWCTKWFQSIEESDNTENHILLHFNWAQVCKNFFIIIF